MQKVLSAIKYYPKLAAKFSEVRMTLLSLLVYLR